MNGKTVTRSTGCEKKANAEAVLREWEADAEKVKSGLLKPEDIQAKLEAKKGLEKHLADFQTYMETKRRGTRHISETVKHVTKMATTCAGSPFQT